MSTIPLSVANGRISVDGLILAMTGTHGFPSSAPTIRLLYRGINEPVIIYYDNSEQRDADLKLIHEAWEKAG